MRSIMNEVSKYIGTAVIILVLLLIILRTLNWQTDIINRMMTVREGFMDESESESDSESDSENECDENDTRDKIEQLYKASKKHKDVSKERSSQGPFGALKYYKDHYDSDDGWDSETDELKKICFKMKKQSKKNEYAKDIDNIIAGSSMNIKTGGGGGFF